MQAIFINYNKLKRGIIIVARNKINLINKKESNFNKSENK